MSQATSLLISMIKRSSFYPVKQFFILKVLFIGLLLLVIDGYGQSQKTIRLEKLEAIINSGDYDFAEELAILDTLATETEDPNKKLAFSIALIEKAEAVDSADWLFTGYLHKGHALRLKSDLTKALEAYFEAARLSNEKGWKRESGLIDVSVADVYGIMGNHSYSVAYYRKGIEALRAAEDSLGFASALENLGDEYLTIGNADSALLCLSESGMIFRKINFKTGIAYNLGNIGIAYALQGKNELAQAHMNEAINTLEKLEDFYPISVYLTYIADLYAEKNDWASALGYAEKSLELAQNYSLKDQISDANLKLAELHEQMGNPGEANKYFKAHIAYKDSVNNIRAVQEMADMRTEFEVSQKQIEVDLLNEQKRNQQITVVATIIALVLLALLTIGLLHRFNFIRKTKNIIQGEKQRSDNLLLNILPGDTADELKESGKVKAKRYESVTVLFTDFKEFTGYAENLSPEELVASVDFYFSHFDEIIDKYGLEKIKTVGDAYMCAGGLPIPSEDHAIKMVNAALEINAFVNEVKKDKSNLRSQFDIRLGLNSGPVIAGVVGTKKFAYDIWGDTVNIASRMESKSEPGRINISENTYNLIKDYFDCEYRGEIEAKNKGMLKMYFVNGAKST